MEFSKTYIETLDSALKGGFPKAHSILVTGSSGTGKTTLSFEYLMNGVKKNKEKTIYFAITEELNTIIKDFEEFSFFDTKSVQNGELLIIDLRTVPSLKNEKMDILSDSMEILNLISEQIRQTGAKRIVIDSITTICSYIDDPREIKKFIFRLNNILNVYDCTSLLISEVPPGIRKYSNYNVEEFMCDGILFLDQVEYKNSLVKTLEIVKMRGVAHSSEKLRMDITTSGIQVYPLIKEG